MYFQLSVLLCFARIRKEKSQVQGPLFQASQSYTMIKVKKQEYSLIFPCVRGKKSFPYPYRKFILRIYLSSIDPYSLLWYQGRLGKENFGTLSFSNWREVFKSSWEKIMRYCYWVGNTQHYPWYLRPLIRWP